MSEKHTPGPWVYSPTNIGKEYSVGYGISSERSGWTLVHVPTHDPEDGGSAEANAMLVAAAPDLLAALKLAESVYRQNCVSPGEPSSVLDAMRAAIAKAESR